MCTVSSGVIKVWRINRSSDALTTVITSGDESVHKLAMSANGSNVASSGRSVKLWKLDDEGLECLEYIQTFEEPTAYMAFCTQFTPDENFLAAGYSDGSIRFWKLEDGTCSRVYHSGVVVALKYSPDGSRLLVQCRSGAFLKSLSPVQNQEEGPSEA